MSIQALKNKVLVSFCSYNAPHFLEHLITSIERHDAGYPFDLLILDNLSTDLNQLKLLDKYAKRYRVETKENYGRAQGGYDYAWQNNKDYQYYFFLHDDSAILRDNWLKLAVDRINDEDYYEKGLLLKKHTPVGKVGFQCYSWGDEKKYFTTGHPQIFQYMKPIADMLNVVIPCAYQHVNDDKYLIRNELLQEMGRIWNIEDFKQMEINKDPILENIHKWFIQNGMHNSTPFAPHERYGPNYHTFQTVSEFLSDIAPMRYGYRTHCVLGDGYSQEELGWSSFRGNEYIAHYGDHVVFKRLALLLKTSEEDIRSRFKDKTFLTICDNIIRKETSHVER